MIIYISSALEDNVEKPPSDPRIQLRPRCRAGPCSKRRNDIRCLSGWIRPNSRSGNENSGENSHRPGGKTSLASVIPIADIYRESIYCQ